MQLEQLIHIVYANKYKSLTKAAEVLHVSQSALSQSISKLEQELNVVLFTRSRMGVSPTEEADFFIKKAESILYEVDAITAKAKKISSLNNKKLIIGTISGLHISFFTSILLQLKEQFPDLVVNYIENKSLALQEAILNKEIDISLIVIYEQTNRKQDLLITKPLMEARMFLLVNKHSKFATETKVSPAQISNEPLAMYEGEFMNWYLENYIQRNGDVNLLFKSSNIETLRETVLKGLAITIESEVEIYNNPYIKSGEVIPIPLADPNTPNVSFGLTYLKSRPPSAEAKVFIHSLVKQLSTWKNENII